MILMYSKKSLRTSSNHVNGINNCNVKPELFDIMKSCIIGKSHKKTARFKSSLVMSMPGGVSKECAC